MPRPRQDALDALDEKFIETIRTQGDASWVMTNLPALPRLTSAQIDEALDNGALLRPVRPITEDDAVAVVQDAQRRFDGGSLLEPLGWLFTNPIAPVPESDPKFELHPLLSAILLIVIMLIVLALVVHLL